MGAAQVIKEYDLKTVQDYMHHIRDNAEQCVRSLLRKVVGRLGTDVLEARDHLDDGSPVRIAQFCLKQLKKAAFHTDVQVQIHIEINAEAGSATVDFDGTGPEIRGNLNAPISVVHSAVIYCLRAMVDNDIPLNAGCLVPIKSK